MLKCSELIAKTTMSTNRHATNHQQGYNDETRDPFSPMSPPGQDGIIMIGCDSSSKLTADDISGMESGEDGRQTVQVCHKWRDSIQARSCWETFVNLQTK